jgi:hypothetical protein
MIEVEADADAVRITVPTDGMSAEQVNAFVAWLRVEAIARRSQLASQEAAQMSEELKSRWWEANQHRFRE